MMLLSLGARVIALRYAACRSRGHFVSPTHTTRSEMGRRIALGESSDRQRTVCKSNIAKVACLSKDESVST